MHKSFEKHILYNLIWGKNDGLNGSFVKYKFKT